MNEPFCIDRAKRTFPSGFFSVTKAFASANVMHDYFMAMRRLAVYVLVIIAFCAGTGVEIVCA